MMLRLLLATLILSGNLYADSLRVTASADTYIYDQRSVAGTAGSFSIRMAAATDAMTRMNGSLTTTNYATGTTGRVGKNLDVEDRWLMRWATLDDSMRTYATGKSLRWDSARVVVTITTAIAAGDSLTVAMYALRSTRAFLETSATWEIYANSNTWTTGGASSTASDIESPQIDTSITLLSTSTSMSFKLPTAEIADTLNDAGVTIRSFRYGDDDGTTCNATIGSDDNATEGNRPIITVYFTEMEYPDYGGADTLLLKVTNPATQVAHAAMTFDISTITATADLDSAKLWVYVNQNYSDNTESTLDYQVGVAMKPINIGTGTGGATATGKMHWASWCENGTADSAWGTAGAQDGGYVCNRSTATGDDKAQDTLAFAYSMAGAGWKRMMVDTVAIRAYLNGTCANFALFVQPIASSTDDAHYVCSSVEGSNDPFLVVYYTPGATAVTKGTGRFGRANDGRYLNVR